MQWSLLLFLIFSLGAAHHKALYYGNLFPRESPFTDSFATIVNQCYSIERIVNGDYVASKLALFIFSSAHLGNICS